MAEWDAAISFRSGTFTANGETKPLVPAASGHPRVSLLDFPAPVASAFPVEQSEGQDELADE
eukprot:2329377-Pyramimonas_sp.AAC.1